MIVVMFRVSVAAALVAASLSMTGCSSPKFAGRPDLQIAQGGELPAPTQKDLTLPARPYAIGPSDQLAIDVFGIPELSKTLTVDLSGRVSLPLIGPLDVSGKTSDEVSTAIQDRLRGRYVRDPSVSVNITTTASQVVTVEGAVASPGLYPIVGRMSLMRALARASGTTEFAQEGRVVVFREVSGQKYAALYDVRAIRLGAYPDPEIFSNDVISVGDSQARRIFKDILAASPLITTPIIALIQ